MDAFEKIIGDALRFTDVNDPRKRMKVYQNVAKAIESVPEQKRELYKAKLSAFVRKFEAELREKADTDALQSPPVPPAEFQPGQPHEGSFPNDNPGFNEADYPEPEFPGPPTSKISMADNSPGQVKDGGKRRGKRIPKITRNQVLKILLGVLAVVLLLGVLAVLYFYSTGTSQGTSGQTSGSNAEKAAPSQEAVKTIFDISLPQDAGSVSDKLGSERGEEAFLSGLIANNKFAVNESTAFYLGPEFPVDTSKTYLMKLEFERPIKNLTDMRINAGLAVMDKDGNVLRAKPGPHRYFVHRGKVKNTVLSESGGNYVISGSITGEADSALDKFLPGTAKARAVDLGAPARWRSGSHKGSVPD